MLLRLLSILLVCLACPAGVAAEESPAQTRLKVFKVLDGDKVLLRGRGKSYRVQLDGIDAPETDQPWGRLSQQLLEKMIGGKRVIVQFVDAEQTRARLQFLKYDISHEMLVAGGAWALPDAEQSLKAAEAQARAAGKGLWEPGASPPVAPWVWREKN